MMGKSASELKVHVTFRNEDMEPVCEEEYNLAEYTEKLRADLQRVIPDVESLVYLLTGKPRSGWGDDAWRIFSRIRHKLLDKAGEVARIPENLELE